MEPLVEAASKLVGKTSYRRPALREEAPTNTDCLTSIYYVFKQALGIDIPLTFIGDMPRRLLSYSEWRVLKVEIKNVQCGDLLFVRNKKNEKLLSHIALVFELDKIFHCCPSFGTAVIQSKDEFFTLYEQKLNFKKMIRYIDPRNRELREDQRGIFISD
jgi:cell wall-associated NlpC family hydrolase